MDREAWRAAFGGVPRSSRWGSEESVTTEQLNWYFSNKGTHRNLRAVKRDSCTSPSWEYCLCFSIKKKKKKKTNHERSWMWALSGSERECDHLNTREALLGETALSGAEVHVTSRWRPPGADPDQLPRASLPGNLAKLAPSAGSPGSGLMPTITAFHLSQPVPWKGACSYMSPSSSKGARVLFQSSARLVLWGLSLVTMPNAKQFVTRWEHVSLAAHHS